MCLHVSSKSAAGKEITVRSKAKSKEFKRSISLGDQRIEVSQSVQTVDSALEDNNIALNKTNDNKKDNSCTDKLYENVCNKLDEVKCQIKQLTSIIGIGNASDLLDITNRLNGLVKVREHIRDITNTIDVLENAIANKIVTNYQNLLHDRENSYDTEDSMERKDHFKAEDCKTKDPIKHLLRLHMFPHLKQQYYHFSLKSHIDSVERNQSMSNELVRFSSLSTFPRDIDISMTRLARAGFYHTRNLGETKCYSCGITYSNWRSNDDPDNIHRRISPACNLVTMATVDDVKENCIFDQNPKQSEQSQKHTYSIKVNAGDNANINASAPLGAESSRSESYVPSSIATMQTQTPGNNIATNIQSEMPVNSTNKSRDSQSNQYNNGYPDLGITIEKPRYPNYAPLQTRISSYQGWPSYLDQTPRQMALAGFLYAGYNDYTRCFFCGGGLRNWEAGDDPWVEHARWFPMCTFLKQNKGEKFINSVLKQQQELESKQPGNISENVSQQTENSCSENQDDQLSTVAARSVLEMGYSTEQVQGAMEKLNRSTPGAGDISATDIMYVLLNDDDQSTQGATSSAESTETKTPKELGLRQKCEMPADDAESLIEENRQLRDQRLCKVCLDLEASIAFLPCGHIACCSDCAPAMRKCPLCRTYIKGTVKTFFA